jgi:hypothetical protein
MRRALLIAAVLALSAPASAHAAGELYRVGGTGDIEGPLYDGLPAVEAALGDKVPVAALPTGEFLLSTRHEIWRVDPQGALRRVAGTRDTGDAGDTGDGGPAAAARIEADDLDVTPGGGILILDGDSERVRLIGADGTISTVAGGGRSTADGIPATRAALPDPTAIAALPGGGFVVVLQGDHVREVGPDGLIRTVAGGGHGLGPIWGQRATSVEFAVADVAAAADGSLLLADGVNFTIDRVTPDGTIHIAARAARGAITPTSRVAALPGDALAFTEARFDADGNEYARVWQVDPDGTKRLVAGGGPVAATAPLGLEQHEAGGLATGFALGEAQGLAALPDGGLLLSYQPPLAYGSLVGYIAPAAPALLAAALPPGAARVFAPGRPAAVNVALDAPATVSLSVAGQTVHADLPAGASSVALPALPARDHAVTLTAIDAAGRRAYDRTHVVPDGWLPIEIARLVAGARHTDTAAQGCRRFSAARVDCRIEPAEGGCPVITVRYVDERLRWGAYAGCAFHAHPRLRRAVHVLRRRDWLCPGDEPHCRPALFGRVTEAQIIPAD